MSHHYSGPDYGFPRGDARLDLTDLYAFPKPNDPARTILIVNAHPSSSVTSLAPTTVEPFSTAARYELEIDTNGDAVAEITYRVTFSSAASGAQTATVHRIEGAQAAGGQVIVEHVPVSTGREARIADGRGHRFFAGWRSDPFFFDVLGALAGLKFTGNDFFADKDVCSIALEVPNAALGSGSVGLWMRVLVPADDAPQRWIQVERGGRPQLAVFLASAARDAFHAAEPAGDARFVAVYAHALEHAGGYAPDDARRAAEKLLPDILRYDPSRPASYPDNGRALTDDVVAFFLPIFTAGKVKDDMVGPHRDLLDEFPYVGPPHRL
jgi:hypothetical protein